MVVEAALGIVRALGFTSAFDFDTKVLESAITEEAVQPHLQQLRTLKVYSCKSKAKLKTQVSAALSGAIGIKLSGRIQLGKQSRKRGEAYHTLEITKAIQFILETPNELSSDHWYKVVYGEPAPHLNQYKASSESSLEELLSSYNTYIDSSKHVEYCSELKQLIEDKGGSVKWV